MLPFTPSWAAPPTRTGKGDARPTDEANGDSSLTIQTRETEADNEAYNAEKNEEEKGLGGKKGAKRASPKTRNEGGR